MAGTATVLFIAGYLPAPEPVLGRIIANRYLMQLRYCHYRRPLSHRFKYHCVLNTMQRYKDFSIYQIICRKMLFF